MSASDLSKPAPVPFKIALVGSAFCIEPTDEMRAVIEGAVYAALTKIPWAEVHSAYFMWNDNEIKVIPDGQ